MVAVNAPPLTGIVAWAAVSLEVLVTYGVTVAPLAVPVPDRENVTGSAVCAVLSATMATEPSVFLNAVRSSALLELVAAMRTAPGRTNRLYVAKAQSLPEELTVEPLIWIRLSLSPLVDGVALPHQ